METKEATTQEVKLLKVLELLNTCREKTKALCNLFNAQVLNAKGDSQNMSSLLDAVIEKHNDLKGVASVLPKKTKDERTKLVKASRPIVKNTQNSLEDLKTSFLDSYSNFKNVLNDPMKLRATYKAEVVSCCDAFKKFLGEKVVAGTDKIQKGYRQQVKMIKAILDKIKTLIEVYKQEEQKVEEIKKQFDNITKLVERLAGDLNSLVVA